MSEVNTNSTPKQNLNPRFHHLEYLILGIIETILFFLTLKFIQMFLKKSTEKSTDYSARKRFPIPTLNDKSLQVFLFGTCHNLLNPNKSKSEEKKKITDLQKKINKIDLFFLFINIIYNTTHLKGFFEDQPM